MILKKLATSYSKLFYLLIILIGFANFNFDIGFSLKPFMIWSFISFFLVATKLKFVKLRNYEICLIAFYVSYILTILQLRYIEANLRFVILFTIIMFFYILWRCIIRKISLYNIEESISKAGIIICIMSLIYYIYGLYRVGFQLEMTGATSYGVMFDRGYPRLCGTISEPNITPYFLTLFFFYYLYHLNNYRNRLGFILCLLVIVLSLSRGALLAIGIVFLMMNLIYFNKMLILKLLIFTLIIILLYPFLADFLGFDFGKAVISRFESSADDNGSGRMNIWACYWNNFLEYPFWGIGINSSISYNSLRYSQSHYAHNTYLEILSEGGIIGFIPFLCLVLLGLFKLYRLQKCFVPIRYLFATFLAMLIQMSFLSLTYSEMFYFVILLIFRYDLFLSHVNLCSNYGIRDFDFYNVSARYGNCKGISH